MNIKQLIIICVVGMVLLSGCAYMVEKIPGFTHTAALVIGDSEKNVLQQLEHILADPKQEAFSGKDTPDEIKIRRYAFSNVYDLVLYFHKGIFFQAGLMEPNSNTYPAFREDFKEVHKGSFGPIGYMVTFNGKILSIDTLWREGEEPKE